MANIDSAFGFRPIRRLDGAAWTGNHTTRKMLTNATALNRGDVVQALPSGYVQAITGAVADHSGLGVFVGCHYLAASLGYPIWSNYWPGAGAVGEVDAFIIDDPIVVFEVQAAAGPITLRRCRDDRQSHCRCLHHWVLQVDAGCACGLGDRCYSASLRWVIRLRWSATATTTPRQTTSLRWRGTITFIGRWSASNARKFEGNELMAIDLASIKNELFPGLAAVEGRYKKIETKWSRCL